MIEIFESERRLQLNDLLKDVAFDCWDFVMYLIANENLSNIGLMSSMSIRVPVAILIIS